MAGVASAAVVSGELIIGLDDGRIIRAGYVQGPTGLTGPEGAVGATGQRGMDGNTILSGAEKPKPEAGKEGDFWINTRDWFIYGPKTSGQWGTGTYMLGPKEYLKNNRSNQGGGGTAPSSEPGGGTGTVYSNTVYRSGTGRAINAPGGNIIPEGKSLSVQSNLNKWIENSLRALDTKLPVAVVDSLPGTGQYDGDLALFEGALYVWVGSEWIKVSADGGAHIGVAPPTPAVEGQLWFNNSEDELTLYIYAGKDWVPASPPVSLDGISTTITGIEGDLIELHNNVRQVKGDIVLTNQDLQLLAQDQTRQDEKISEVDENLDGKLDKTGGQLTGRLVTNSPIWIHPGGQGANGEHNMLVVNQAGADTGSVARFQQNGEDILKIEHAKTINACGNNITNLADPEHERHAVTKQWAEGRYALKSDVPAPPDVVPPLSFAASSNVDPRNKSAPDPGQIVGYFENEPGDGSKSFNYYIGNWNHSVLVNVADLKVAGTLPDDGANDFNHRGVFEMRTSGGDELLHKAIVKSITRSGDILTLLFEGGINLFGQSDTSAQSSARYLFYSF